MRVLSLFDGISCGQVALERAGIPVEVYYASEIDKYAIQVTQKNYPNTIQLGDVTKINFEEFIGKVDIIIGGSPCQDLSIAKQNRQGLHGERSKLFWKYVEALDVIRPKWFLLENVASMKKEDRDAITETLKMIYPDSECIMIDSALVSAQQRKRYYWTNWKVNQPEDKYLYLKDVLNLDTNESLQNKIVMYKRTQSVRVRKHKVDIENLKQLLSASKKLSKLSNKKIAEILRKPITLVEHWFRSDSSFSIPSDDVWFDLKHLLGIKTDVFDKAITEFEVRDGRYDSSNRIYHISGKSPTLTTITGGKQRKIIIDDEGDLFFLEPEHYETLQTLPLNYTAGISDRQRYKALGNGWTVDVIAHIFNGLKEVA